MKLKEIFTLFVLILCCLIISGCTEEKEEKKVASTESLVTTEALTTTALPETTAKPVTTVSATTTAPVTTVPVTTTLPVITNPYVSILDNNGECYTLADYYSFFEKLNYSLIVTYGHYEQDGNLANGPEPIEWFVLEEKDGKFLLLSKKALEYMPYDNIGEATNEYTGKITWENCSIRKWLNEKFFYNAFSENERRCIIETNIKTVHSLDYIKNQDFTVNTKDKVFLLSMDEEWQYRVQNNLPIYSYKSSYATRKVSRGFSALRDASKNMYGAYAVSFINLNSPEYIYPALWIDTNDRAFNDTYFNPITAIDVDKQSAIVVSTNIGGCSNYNSNFGLNNYRQVVAWDLEIEFDRDIYNKIEDIICSWEENIIDITGKTYVGSYYGDYGWSSAKSGNTLVDRHNRVIEIRLPNDKSIEGAQYIMLGDIVISFDLVWCGDYSTGDGWDVKNIIVYNR